MERSDAADDVVDVVDQDDRVVGTVTRAEMRARRLRHRCVSVIVRDLERRVLVHRRSPDKDIWPGRWDLAVGGVVATREAYDAAAVRELAEEVGITAADITCIRHTTYDDADVSEQVRLYETTWTGPIHFADGEVVEARWVTAEELAALVEHEQFCPDSLAVALELI